MLSSDIYGVYTPEIICLFPGSSGLAYVAWKVDDRMNMTPANLRAVRKAVAALPMPSFEVSEQQETDERLRHRWAGFDVRQIGGPFVADFTITSTETVLGVCLNGGETQTDEDNFLIVSDAVAAIGRPLEWILTRWGIKIA